MDAFGSPSRGFLNHSGGPETIGARIPCKKGYIILSKLLYAFLAVLKFNAASLEAGIINPNIDYLEIIGTDRSRSIRGHYYSRGTRSLCTLIISRFSIRRRNRRRDRTMSLARPQSTWRHILDMFHSRVGLNTLPHPGNLVLVRSILAIFSSGLPNY